MHLAELQFPPNRVEIFARISGVRFSDVSGVLCWILGTFISRRKLQIFNFLHCSLRRQTLVEQVPYA